MTLAEARFKALKDHSAPDLGVQGHVVEPLKIEKDWVETNKSFDHPPKKSFDHPNKLRTGPKSKWDKTETP